MADNISESLPRIKEVRAFVKKATGDQGNNKKKSSSAFRLKNQSCPPTTDKVALERVYVIVL